VSSNGFGRIGSVDEVCEGFGFQSSISASYGFFVLLEFNQEEIK
jgi:hypothetical protein